MSLTLTSCCPVCRSKENLSRCLGCYVTLYCGREHQIAHRNEHKGACNAIKKSKQALDNEEQKLRAHPGDWMTPANVFEEGAGHFWGIVETRPYMTARFALVEALLKIKTTLAVQAAHSHLMDMLRLCRGDNMGVRDLVPALYLRLGKDQECYDFVKWWATTAENSHYDWGDTSLPYLHLKDEDVFEPIGLFTRRFAELTHAVSVTLIKIRLLLDVRSLQNSTVVGAKVPKELLDKIRGHLVSTVVAKRKDIMDSEDQGPLIKKLESQVEKLYTFVKESNKYFWPALLKPGANLTERPGIYSAGTREHMKLVLQYSYDSWIETPKAIDIIRELAAKDASN